MTQAEPIKFDRERAGNYDIDIRKAIPGYEALHEMAYTLLEMNANQQSRRYSALKRRSDPASAKDARERAPMRSLLRLRQVLVVGSGTGMEIINLCQRNPHWRFTGVEPSADMMTIAKSRLKTRGFQERVNLHQGYVDSLPATKVMDAATLILVMHFIPNDGSKLLLLQNIAKRLKPGANLVLADLHGERESASFPDLLLAWKSFYFNRLEDVSVEVETNFQKAINSIHFIPETKILGLLQTAGFTDINRFYNAFLFGGWSARLR